MNSPSDQSPRPPARRHLRLPLLGVAIAPIPLIFLLSANSDQASSRLNLASIASGVDEALPTATTGKPAPIPVQQRMLGVWEDDYQGHRLLTLNDDGTGSMVIELGGAAASLFADRLEFHQQWAFDDDRELITMTAVGGEPQTKVNLVLRIYGKEATYKVDEVADSLLVLIDQADQKRYEWRRVAETDNADDLTRSRKDAKADD
ncbi:hypothetical protein GC176_13850 [bacterium]|nr:hypothetical protein [bacterium]